MTNEEAIAALDSIGAGDPEAAHCVADGILMNMVPVEVRDAYSRVIDRQEWWACA